MHFIYFVHYLQSSYTRIIKNIITSIMNQLDIEFQNDTTYHVIRNDDFISNPRNELYEKHCYSFDISGLPKKTQIFLFIIMRPHTYECLHQILVNNSMIKYDYYNKKKVFGVIIQMNSLDRPQNTIQMIFDKPDIACDAITIYLLSHKLAWFTPLPVLTHSHKKRFIVLKKHELHTTYMSILEQYLGINNTQRKHKHRKIDHIESYNYHSSTSSESHTCHSSTTCCPTSNTCHSSTTCCPTSDTCSSTTCCPTSDTCHTSTTCCPTSDTCSSTTCCPTSDSTTECKNPCQRSDSAELTDMSDYPNYVFPGFHVIDNEINKHIAYATKKCNKTHPVHDHTKITSKKHIDVNHYKTIMKHHQDRKNISHVGSYRQVKNKLQHEKK